MRMSYLVILITLLTVNACSSSKKIPDGKILAKENGEAQLGNSALYLVLPPSLEMYQLHGEEGYIAYNLFSKDPGAGITAEMVIWSGRTIVSGFEESKVKTDSVSSKILDKQILWTIYKTDKGLFANARSEYGFFIWTKERKDIDQMIAVFSTLKLKKK